MKDKMKFMEDSIKYIENMDSIDLYKSLVSSGLLTGEEKFSVYGNMGVGYDNYLLKSGLSFTEAKVKEKYYYSTWRNVFLREEI